MGKRRRVQLKRIENKIDRQVTFSKRKPGLIKKANEICLIMDAILERYERQCCVAEKLVATDQELLRNWSSEYTSVKAKVEVLQRNQRHMMGEDLESFSVKELQNLEHQLDTSLKNIKSRKNQLLYESISELQRKEKALKEQNTVLGEKIKEKEQEPGTLGQQQRNQAQAQNTCPKARTHRPSFSRRNFLMSLLQEP
ncbi:hypothetical protein MKW92_034195 [Papaver armeniacum]|nr:hypothetical protein MKW92_034195 [Papaver armeniacum]